MTEPSEYVLEPIREGADFTLYRGRQSGNPSPVLAVALAAEQPSPQSLRRLEHEYSLADELDSEWAAKPLALTRHEGRTILILTDPGGEPLDRVLERHQGQSVAIRVDTFGGDYRGRVDSLPAPAVHSLTTFRRKMRLVTMWPPACSDLQNPHYTKVVLRPAW